MVLFLLIIYTIFREWFNSSFLNREVILLMSFGFITRNPLSVEGTL